MGLHRVCEGRTAHYSCGIPKFLFCIWTGCTFHDLWKTLQDKAAQEAGGLELTAVHRKVLLRLLWQRPRDITFKPRRWVLCALEAASTCLAVCELMQSAWGQMPLARLRILSCKDPCSNTGLSCPA